MFFDLVRSKVDIIDVIRSKTNLQRRGNEYIGLCPFHSEKTPSFTVNPSKKFYFCFGCSASGDVIKFASETTGLRYREAAVKLANDYNITIPTASPNEQKEKDEVEQVLGVLELANSFYKQSLNKESVTYLENRQIDQSLISKFEIGFSLPGIQSYLEKNDIPLFLIMKSGLLNKREDSSIYEIMRNRIIFPIRNVYNKIVGFGGRTINESNSVKYINSPETIVFKKGEVLYGENIAFSAAYKAKRIIVVEGYLDLIAMHKVGLNETVASLGTSITEYNLSKMWKVTDEVIMCLDGDLAGFRAAKRVINLCLDKITADKSLSFVVMPPKYDPDDLIKEYGGNYILNLIDKRFTLSEMIFYLETKNKKFISSESKAKLQNALSAYVKMIKDRYLSYNYDRYFRNKCWELFYARSKKTPNLSLEIKYSDQEYGLLVLIMNLIVKFPEFCKEFAVYEALVNMEFKFLQNFKEFLLSLVVVEKQLSFQTIEEAAKKCGLCEVFNISSRINPSTIEDPLLFWEVIVKKYNIYRLMLEIVCINANDDEDSFKRKNACIRELIELEKNIKQLGQ